MNASARLWLFLTCALVGALEGPRAMHVLVEDLCGPYSCSEDEPAAPSDVIAFTDPAQGDLDDLDVDTGLVARRDGR